MHAHERHRKHKRYDEAFKRSAAEHWLVSGKSARQITTELGINEKSLKQWNLKFKQQPAGQVAPPGRASDAWTFCAQPDPPTLPRASH